MMDIPSQVYVSARKIYRKLTSKNLSLREVLYEQIINDSPARTNSYLSALLEYATAHIPYYKNLISSHSYNSSNFSELPILTKSIIRENFDNLKSDELASRGYYFNSSGGSTGKPLQVIQDAEYEEWREATELFFYRQFLDIEAVVTSQVILWGSQTDIQQQTQKKNLTTRQKLLTIIQPQTTFLNSFKMTKEDLHEYVEVINQKKPKLIKSYAGSLYQLAKFVKENNLSIHSPKRIHTSAETLRQFMRELIEDVFNCKIYDFYGSREVGAIAGECAKGKIHIFNFNNHLEVVDKNNKPVQPGEEGRILITTLHNYSMPLIRYEIGDTGILGKPCNCGSKLPTLEKITGRIKDHFITREGTLVDGGYFTRQFYFRNWIDEFQVLQTDFEKIDIYYVPIGQPVESEMAEICDKVKQVMGEKCEIKWHQVEEVPRTPQGKLLYTRSLVEL
ncbi:MAG: phenylacetate--CoA ligase family protein [Okeania sp. SIO2C9]|uniref:phenylacetate--CoA ligase family protein n=1 Tax=Okeania sp. SIO2C9 TaxID=2607791 RepID=UPI0013BF979D|nr:hypothetical protein [Okeania sp. SIO2C9]NEQ74545.1 phenylacetate--CoA ligase family protein [Okeania sp. SIO2C9]